MKLFKEISVWQRHRPNIAVRYSGFQNIDTGKFWFSFANFLDSEKDDGYEYPDVLGLDSLVSDFLLELPEDGDEWRSSIREAIHYFHEKNPGLFSG